MAILSPDDRDQLEVDVIIEVSASHGPVKYEFDKQAGLLRVDRFLHTSMVYPCNYGFIPDTLSGDEDPVDVLLYSTYPVVPGALVRCRPIGVFITEDEKGKDAKILCIPTTKVDPFLKEIKTYKDLPELFLKQVAHFFEHYKDLEKDKWVKTVGWEGELEARDIIRQAIRSYGDFTV